jgi:hypothetical protein
MQEFILTIVAFYVLFRVFGRNVKVYHYNNFYGFGKREEKQKEGTVIIQDPSGKKTSPQRKTDKKEEYVDFEEIR